MNSTSENNFWEDSIYSKGFHLNKYPFDIVVSFVYRNLPKNKPRNEVKILEMGCGAGNNLWFAAREGFSVVGLDLSSSAVEFCRNRFRQDGLKGDFIVGNFNALPVEDNSVDLVIDRASITCCAYNDARTAIGEVLRVLSPGGRFFFNAYSSGHSSYGTGELNADGTWSDMKKGTLSGIDHIYFFNKEEALALFDTAQWQILKFEHLSCEEMILDQKEVHAEWRIIVEKR